MNIFITGGNGFIGRNLINKLNNYGYQIYSPSSKLVDISNLSQMESYLKDKKIDIIIHLAAYADIDDNLEVTMKINVLGTYNLMLVAKKYSIPKVIFASTNNVYGTNGVYTESSDLQPNSLYGKSKHISETLVREMGAESGLSTVVLRFSDIYGLNQKYGNLFKAFFNNSLELKPLTIMGAGARTRDYVYIKDVVDSIVYFTESELSGIYNVSSGKGISTEDLALIMNKVISSNKNSIYYRELQEGEEDTTCIVLKNDKAIKDGVPLKYTLEMGLQDMLEEREK